MKTNKKDEEGKADEFSYPANEDIYLHGKELSYDSLNEEEDIGEGKTYYEDPGRDLDVPGSELDDADEAIGEEDEENNYYSLGGDNHEDLDESNDDIL